MPIGWSLREKINSLPTDSQNAG